MRKSVLCLMAGMTLLLSAGLGAAPALGRATRHRGAATTPTAAQIQSAVDDAKSSSFLWATVNVCVTKGAGGTIGIRGEMPSLGFASTMTMTVQLQRYDTSTRSYAPIAGSTAATTVTVSRAADGVHQGGAAFPFSADPGRIDASVTFTWTRAGHTLGTLTEQTTGGHPSAAYGQPAHHSAASCVLSA